MRYLPLCGLLGRLCDSWIRGWFLYKKLLNRGRRRSEWVSVWMCVCRGFCAFIFELPSTPIQTQHREGRWTIGDKGIIILPMDEQQVNRWIILWIVIITPSIGYKTHSLALSRLETALWTDALWVDSMVINCFTGVLAGTLVVGGVWGAQHSWLLSPWTVVARRRRRCPCPLSDNSEMVLICSRVGPGR